MQQNIQQGNIQKALIVEAQKKITAKQQELQGNATIQATTEQESQKLQKLWSLLQNFDRQLYSNWPKDDLWLIQLNCILERELYGMLEGLEGLWSAQNLYNEPLSLVDLSQLKANTAVNIINDQASANYDINIKNVSYFNIAYNAEQNALNALQNAKDSTGFKKAAEKAEKGAKELDEKIDKLVGEAALTLGGETVSWGIVTAVASSRSITPNGQGRYTVEVESNKNTTQKYTATKEELAKIAVAYHSLAALHDASKSCEKMASIAKKMEHEMQNNEEEKLKLEKLRLDKQKEERERKAAEFKAKNDAQYKNAEDAQTVVKNGIDALIGEIEKTTNPNVQFEILRYIVSTGASGPMGGNQDKTGLRHDLADYTNQASYWHKFSTFATSVGDGIIVNPPSPISHYTNHGMDEFQNFPTEKKAEIIKKAITGLKDKLKHFTDEAQNTNKKLEEAGRNFATISNVWTYNQQSGKCTPNTNGAVNDNETKIATQYETARADQKKAAENLAYFTMLCLPFAKWQNGNPEQPLENTSNVDFLKAYLGGEESVMNSNNQTNYLDQSHRTSMSHTLKSQFEFPRYKNDFINRKFNAIVTGGQHNQAGENRLFELFGVSAEEMKATRDAIKNECETNLQNNKNSDADYPLANKHGIWWNGRTFEVRSSWKGMTPEHQQTLTNSIGWKIQKYCEAEYQEYAKAKEAALKKNENTSIHQAGGTTDERNYRGKIVNNFTHSPIYVKYTDQKGNKCEYGCTNAQDLIDKIAATIAEQAAGEALSLIPEVYTKQGKTDSTLRENLREIAKESELGGKLANILRGKDLNFQLNKEMSDTEKKEKNEDIMKNLIKKQIIQVGTNGKITVDATNNNDLKKAFTEVATGSTDEIQKSFEFECQITGAMVALEVGLNSIAETEKRFGEILKGINASTLTGEAKSKLQERIEAARKIMERVKNGQFLQPYLKGIEPKGIEEYKGVLNQKYEGVLNQKGVAEENLYKITDPAALMTIMTLTDGKATVLRKHLAECWFNKEGKMCLAKDDKYSGVSTDFVKAATVGTLIQTPNDSRHVYYDKDEEDEKKTKTMSLSEFKLATALGANATQQHNFDAMEKFIGKVAVKKAREFVNNVNDQTSITYKYVNNGKEGTATLTAMDLSAGFVYKKDRDGVEKCTITKTLSFTDITKDDYTKVKEVLDGLRNDDAVGGFEIFPTFTPNDGSDREGENPKGSVTISIVGSLDENFEAKSEAEAKVALNAVINAIINSATIKIPTANKIKEILSERREEMKNMHSLLISESNEGKDIKYEKGGKTMCVETTTRGIPVPETEEVLIVKNEKEDAEAKDAGFAVELGLFDATNKEVPNLTIKKFGWDAGKGQPIYKAISAVGVPYDVNVTEGADTEGADAEKTPVKCSIPEQMIFKIDGKYVSALSPIQWKANNTADFTVEGKKFTVTRTLDVGGSYIYTTNPQDIQYVDSIDKKGNLQIGYKVLDNQKNSIFPNDPKTKDFLTEIAGSTDMKADPKSIIVVINGKYHVATPNGNNWETDDHKTIKKADDSKYTYEGNIVQAFAIGEVKKPVTIDHLLLQAQEPDKYKIFHKLQKDTVDAKSAEWDPTPNNMANDFVPVGDDGKIIKIQGHTATHWKNIKGVLTPHLMIDGVEVELTFKDGKYKPTTGALNTVGQEYKYDSSGKNSESFTFKRSVIALDNTIGKLGWVAPYDKYIRQSTFGPVISAYVSFYMNGQNHRIPQEIVSQISRIVGALNPNNAYRAAVRADEEFGDNNQIGAPFIVNFFGSLEPVTPEGIAEHEAYNLMPEIIANLQVVNNIESNNRYTSDQNSYNNTKIKLRADLLNLVKFTKNMKGQGGGAKYKQILTDIFNNGTFNAKFPDFNWQTNEDDAIQHAIQFIIPEGKPNGKAPIRDMSPDTIYATAKELTAPAVTDNVAIIQGKLDKYTLSMAQMLGMSYYKFETIFDVDGKNGDKNTLNAFQKTDEYGALPTVKQEKFDKLYNLCKYIASLRDPEVLKGAEYTAIIKNANNLHDKIVNIEDANKKMEKWGEFQGSQELKDINATLNTLTKGAEMSKIGLAEPDKMADKKKGDLEMRRDIFGFAQALTNKSALKGMMKEPMHAFEKWIDNAPGLIQIKTKEAIAGKDPRQNKPAEYTISVTSQFHIYMEMFTGIAKSIGLRQTHINAEVIRIKNAIKDTETKIGDETKNSPRESILQESLKLYKLELDAALDNQKNIYTDVKRLLKQEEKLKMVYGNNLQTIFDTYNAEAKKIDSKHTQVKPDEPFTSVIKGVEATYDLNGKELKDIVQKAKDRRDNKTLYKMKQFVWTGGQEKESTFKNEKTNAQTKQYDGSISQELSQYLQESYFKEITTKGNVGKIVETFVDTTKLNTTHAGWGNAIKALLGNSDYSKNLEKLLSKRYEEMTPKPHKVDDKYVLYRQDVDGLYQFTITGDGTIKGMRDGMDIIASINISKIEECVKTVKIKQKLVGNQKILDVTNIAYNDKGVYEVKKTKLALNGGQYAAVPEDQADKVKTKNIERTTPEDIADGVNKGR